MYSNAKTNHSVYKLLSVLLFVLPSTVVLNAQNTVIMEIISGGNSIKSDTINITPPKDKAQDVLVSVGDNLPSGAIIKTSDTKLMLNAEGNEQEILPNSTHTIVRITSKEHAHKTIRGKSIHYVNNKTVVYKASGKKKIYAKAPSTVFSVAVDGEAVTFNTIEGQIATVEEVKIKVKQDYGKRTSEKDRPLTTGKTTYINAGESKYFDGNEIVDEFESYDKALAAIQQQLENNKIAGYVDSEQIANEYLLIGELYLDQGNANNAITYFETAINYFYDLEFRELSIAEGNLLLAEVYYMEENTVLVAKYTNRAIELIKPVLQFYKTEYRYAGEDGDWDLMEDIAYDLFDAYDYLGWAYELMEDDDTADYYYDKADELDIGY